MPASEKRKVLFVGDDQFLCDWYLKNLNENGYQAEGATLKEMEMALSEFPADLVLMDLPHEADSHHFIAQVLRIRPATPVVLSVEPERFHFASKAIRSGAAEILPKIVEPHLMLIILHRVLEEDRLLRENKELRDSIKLYGACQRITTQLKREGVRGATLDALLIKAVPHAAFYLDCPSLDAMLQPEGLVGLNEVEAKMFLEELIPSIELRFNLTEAYRIAFDEHDGTFSRLREHGYVEALFIPLRDHERLWVLFILLRQNQDPPWTAKVVEEVNFIKQHAALAWHHVTLYENAKELAMLDDLTGLYNVRYLHQAIGRELIHYQKTGTPFAVLFLDIDYLKRVNDLHGHQVGSQLLIEVARMIRRCVRDNDVVVRYGGDEFNIVLKATPLSVAERVADRIRTTIARHSFLSREGLNVQITVCIGVASCPIHAQSEEELIFLSDRAMYRGKNSTRNLVITANPEDLTGLKVATP